MVHDAVFHFGAHIILSKTSTVMEGHTDFSFFASFSLVSKIVSFYLVEIMKGGDFV